MWKSKKKFKVLKEWLWIDYYSLDNALFEQNLLMTRLREENKKLEEKYERLKADYIKLSKIVEINWGYRASYVNELIDKIANLEQELYIWKLTARDYARLQWVELPELSDI